MATLNISLPQSMRKFVEQQVANGGYSTASEYVRDLIRQAEKHATREWLEGELLKGVNSGPGIQANDDYWRAKRAKLIAGVSRQTHSRRQAK